MFRSNIEHFPTSRSFLPIKVGDTFLQYENGVKGDHGWIYAITEDLRVGFIQERFLTKLEETQESTKNYITNLMIKTQAKIDEAVDFRAKREHESMLEILRRQRNNLNKEENLENSEVQRILQGPKHATAVRSSFLKSAFTSLKRKRSLQELANAQVFKKLTKINRKAKGAHLHFQIPEELAYRILETMRNNSAMTHYQAKSNACQILQLLQYGLPRLNDLWEELMYQIKHSTPPMDVLNTGQDWSTIKTMFDSLSNLKNNAEELNWAVKQDKTIIIEMLNRFKLLLSKVDEYAVRKLLRSENHEDVSSLIDYFEKEIRPDVRIALLDIIDLLCRLDRTAISVFLNSNIPSSLARDMRNNEKDILYLMGNGKMLLLLLSVGEPLPQTQFAYLNPKFVNFLLNLMEVPPSDLDANEIIEMCTKLLLAFNLQFDDQRENVVLKGIVERQSANVFVRQLIDMLNRQEDPIQDISKHEPKPSNTVIRMLLDLTYDKEAARTIYTNDLKVLIQIIARELSNATSSGNKCEKFLRMIYFILVNTNYEEHLTSYADFKRNFEQILSDNDEDEEINVQIVSTIYLEFSHLFQTDDNGSDRPRMSEAIPGTSTEYPK